ncbi:MAG: tetratricopeptide repeat protein [Spirochaetota bacterium]
MRLGCFLFIVRALFFCMGLPTILGAETGHNAKAVFIVTDPFGARVELAGAEIGKSPLVLTDVEPGDYLLEIDLIGYHPVSLEITVEAGRPSIFRFDLSRSYVFTGFPEEERVAVEGAEFGERFFALPPGKYGFDKEGKTLSVRPQYPGQRVIDALNIAIPIVTAFTIALTVVEALQPRIGGLPLSPFVLSAYGVDAALIGASIGLYIQRGKFYRNFTYAAAAGSAEDARGLFTSGIEALDEGELDEAAGRFEELSVKYPHSAYTPEALYRIARIHLIQDKTDQAEIYLTRIIERYPVPEYYDQCRKLLSDIYLARREYKKSLEQLDSVLYVSEVYSREDIGLFRCKALTQRGLAGAGAERKRGLEEAEESWRGLIEKYPGSENLPFYRYNLALVLGEAGNTEAAVEVLDALLREDLSGVQKRQLEILRRRFSPDRPSK